MKCVCQSELGSGTKIAEKYRSDCKVRREPIQLFISKMHLNKYECDTKVWNKENKTESNFDRAIVWSCKVGKLTLTKFFGVKRS